MVTKTMFGNDEMRPRMSYFHETICKCVLKFLCRVATILKNIGINERAPYNASVIRFSSEEESRPLHFLKTW